jgi:hypothetical protein
MLQDVEESSMIPTKEFLRLNLYIKLHSNENAIEKPIDYEYMLITNRLVIL